MYGGDYYKKNIHQKITVINYVGYFKKKFNTYHQKKGKKNVG